MRKLILYVILVAVNSVYGQDKPQTFQMTEGDSIFTMRQYFMCFLKSGAETTMDSAEVAKTQQLHLANITAMVNAGTVCMAGPFGDNGAIRGILIFTTA